MRKWICILRFDFHAYVIRDVHIVEMKRETFEMNAEIYFLCAMNRKADFVCYLREIHLSRTLLVSYISLTFWKANVFVLSITLLPISYLLTGLWLPIRYLSLYWAQNR